MGKKFYAMMAVLAFAAGGMDVNAVYTLDGIEVSADRQKDRFGNMITEQSYYRTGGDVQVIDSDTIEKRHYTQVGDALKYIPGVQVQTPGGYRGGEYGYTQTHSIVSINGDARVIILVDGRRMDNSVGNPVSDYAAGSKSIIDVNQIVGMDNIEKIEVIKGPGASAGCFYLWGGCHRRRHKHYYQEGGAEACRNNRFLRRIVEAVQLRADLFRK